MKKPLDRGASINLKRYRKWAKEFASFRHQITEDRIRTWLSEFEVEHLDTIARVLDAVDFITFEQIAGAFRHTLEGLEGWHRNEKKRQGKWRFVAYSSSAGESGDQMISRFRLANNLKGKQYNELFINRSDIVRAELSFEDTVVLVDDFVGSGDQACHFWKEIYGELLAEVGRVYLVVVAGTSRGVARINDETELEAIPHIGLTDADNIFAPQCKPFNKKEKQLILDYCKVVDGANPQGHGECGLLVVFSHTIPNNSIPILGKRNPDWEPLFCRYD